MTGRAGAPRHGYNVWTLNRVLPNLLVLASAALCGLCAFGWFRSRRVRDDLWFGRPGWAVGVGPHRGTVVFYQLNAGAYSLSPGFQHTAGPITADRVGPAATELAVSVATPAGPCPGPECGYDVRASAGRCPECGAIGTAIQ